MAMARKHAERTRAWRRAQAERWKNRVRKYRIVEGREDNPATIGRIARTRTPCSCYMCGNPRRLFGERTWQESGRRGYYS